MFQQYRLSVWVRLVPYVAIFGLAAFFLWLYYPHLGDYALRDWDESIYAQVARQSHDPFAFEWLGQLQLGTNVWFEKPPLVIWLTQVSMFWFGVGEFGARFWMPIFAAGILLLVFTWGRDMTRSWRGGLLASAGLFMIPHFLINAGVLSMDMPVAFFICAAVFAYSRRAVANRYVYLFWLCVAGGVFTKNIVGLLPLPIVMLDSLIARDWQWFWSKVNARAFGLGMICVLPWHIIESVRFGWSFWDVYFIRHVFLRGTTSFETHGQPFWYYRIIFQQIPFLYVAVAGVLVGVYMALRRRREYLLPLLGCVVVFLFFSISRSKGADYIIPVYPYFTVLIGAACYWVVSKAPRIWLSRAVFLFFFGVCVAMGLSFNQYRLTRMASPSYMDVREVADWLHAHAAGAKVWYRPAFFTDAIMDSRVLLVFYSNRYIYGASKDMQFDGADTVFRTRTHIVYKVGAEYYVAAVRYIP